MSPMIYLDNAATSWPKPPPVGEAMARFLAEEAGGPDRGSHRLALAAGRVVKDARAKLARLFAARDPDRIVHCLNCTDALNIAIKGALREGDHVVCTALDHNSVSRPLQHLADAGVITLTRIGFGGDGLIDPDDVRRAMRPNTRLVTVPHASNVIGVIQPLEPLGQVARERDALFLVDAAQSAGVVEIDVERMLVDLLAVPGHKSLLGPTGTGALYVGPRAELQAWREGGTGSDSARPRQPTELPTFLEAGTPNTVGLAGLCAAIDAFDPPRTLQHEQSLVRRFCDAFEDHPRVHIVDSVASDQRVGVVSFLVDGIEPVDVAAILDTSFDIAVRAGLHCAPFAHEALGTAPQGTVRVSPGFTTTEEDIDGLIDAIRQIACS